MNITLYAWSDVEQVRPGAVILDVPKYDHDHPEIDRFPTAYRIDEIRDRLDGRELRGRPLDRKDGKRRVWRFLAGEQVAVEPDEHTAVELIRRLSERAEGSGAVLVLAPGGRPLADIQAETADPDADEQDAS